MEYYLAVEKSEILIHVTPWKNLKTLKSKQKKQGIKDHGSHDSVLVNCVE